MELRTAVVRLCVSDRVHPLIQIPLQYNFFLWWKLGGGGNTSTDETSPIQVYITKLFCKTLKYCSVPGKHYPLSRDRLILLFITF